jgi:hypothetical protein
MKTNLHRFACDKTTAEDGVWREIVPGVEMLLTSSESHRYKSALRTAYLEHGGDLDKALPIAMATGLVLDWRGVIDEDNQPVPHSVEAATELLADPDLWVIRERVAVEASNLGNFRRKELEDAVKN